MKTEKESVSPMSIRLRADRYMGHVQRVLSDGTGADAAMANLETLTM
jgi:hypothetical protein